MIELNRHSGEVVAMDGVFHAFCLSCGHVLGQYRSRESAEQAVRWHVAGVWL